MLVDPAPVVAAPVKPVPNPARPGYATTEFWGALVAPMVFLILSQLNVAHIDTNNPHVEEWTKLGSYLLAAVGTGFYARSRGHMKAGAAVGAGISDLAAQLNSVFPTTTAIAGELKVVDPQFSDQQRNEIASILETSLLKFLPPQVKPGGGGAGGTGNTGAVLTIDDTPAPGGSFQAPKF